VLPVKKIPLLLFKFNLLPESKPKLPVLNLALAPLTEDVTYKLLPIKVDELTTLAVILPLFIWAYDDVNGPKSILLPVIIKVVSLEPTVKTTFLPASPLIAPL